MTTTMTPPALTPRESLRLDYAEPAGFQEGYEDFPGFTIWNLRKAIPGHPVNSTISTKTLDAALDLLHPIAEPSVARKVAEFAQLRSHLE